MLNRRILRVKAMQGLYAYYNSMDANYNLALDRIREIFDSQLLNDHSLDKKEIERKKRLSVKLFQEIVKEGKTKNRSNDAGEPEKIADEFFEQYEEAARKDLNYFRKNIVSEAERIFDLYLMLLLLPGEIAAQEKLEASAKLTVRNNVMERNVIPGIVSLADNMIISKIMKDDKLRDLCSKKKISWKKYSDTIHDFFKNLIKKDKEYLKYRETADKNIEDERIFCLHFYKNILFKNDTFNDFMESMDIHWSDDAEVLKSMVSKTIKNLSAEDHEIEFSTLSKNWPDDKEFFKKIFEHTARHDKEYDEIIAQKSKNWDISRIALTDRIILKMAIGEMINFPGIPIKVTINEYIELSKNFSTPKSKKFVNGILDVVSMELLENGTIKKSGRGLIDNQ
jgi:N utilization substance protein B